MILSKILKISAIFLIFSIGCSTFKYRAYDISETKTSEDPEPNYEITLDQNFQDFTNFMFIGNRIENFSTYFNTYYNAQENYNDAYEDYVNRVLINYNQKQDSIFVKPVLSQESIDKFNTAIEKASKVIQYNKSSQFMDRAVLLIGKSYFYLGDYLKAERKFGEFISKLSSSVYLDEALLNLAKTQLRLENEKPAIERLNSLIKNSKDKNVISESYQSLAEYYLNKKDFQNAIDNFKKAIEYSSDNEFKAQMQFLTASVTSRIKPELAAKEYDKVLDFSPSYDLEYLSRLNAAKYYILTGKFNIAQQMLEDLEVKYRDFPDNLSQIIYLKAMYYDQKKDTKNAQKFYFQVIKNFPNTVSSAEASFKIGEYFENKNDYLRALMYYRFSTEQNSNNSFYALASKKFNIYKRYFELRSVIAGSPINTDYDIEFKKRTIKDFEKLNDPNFKQESEGKGKTGGFNNLTLKLPVNADSTTGEVKDDTITVNIEDTLSSKENKIAEAKFELAELFLYELNKADSSEKYLLELIKESEEYEFSAKVLFALAALYRKTEQSAKSDDILQKIVREYPNSKVANSSRRLLNLTVIEEVYTDESDSLYNIAETNFINKDYYTSLSNFKNLIKTYPNSVHLDKAYYACGWIYENVMYKSDSAYYFYTELINLMPGSEAAAQVAAKVDEYDTYIKSLPADTNSVNNQLNNNQNPVQIENEQKNNENIKNIPGDNYIDPSILEKEFQQSNPEIQQPEIPHQDDGTIPKNTDPKTEEPPKN
jgi:tetratricopeptide (TPR) repeat protein